MHNPFNERYLSSEFTESSQQKLSRDDLIAILGQVDESTETLQSRLQRSYTSIRVEGHENITAGRDIRDNVIAHITLVAPEPKRTTPVRQLRAPVPDFIGRAHVIDEITSAVQRGSGGSVYLIRGMGGIGKTELALKIGHQLASTLPDSHLFVDLQRPDGTPREPLELLKTCIRSLTDANDLPEDITELCAIYRDRLSGKRALILLDNALNKEQVFPLLPPTGCVLLVTSRETFAVPGMKRFTLDGLQSEEARAFLLSISHRIPTEVADQIGFICGYLPLAMRAAGSLLEVEENLDPADYLSQLRDERTSLELIGTEGVDNEVEASFNLSYRRLATETARVFRGLSVFPGSFTAKAEEDVCQDPGHKSLNKLLKHSLVFYDDTTKRYWLHNLLRLFASNLIMEEEQSQVTVRHAQHYVRVFHLGDNDVHQITPQTTPDAHHLEEIEWDNLKAGQSWAANQFLLSPDAASNAELCRNYALEAVKHFRTLFPPREMIRWAIPAVAACRKLEDGQSESLLLQTISSNHARLDEYDLALEFEKQALDLFRKLGDPESETNSLFRAGKLYRALHNAQEAVAYLELSRSRIWDTTNTRLMASVLTELGNVHIDMGERERADEFLELAVATVDRGRDSFDTGSIIGEIASSFSAMEQWDRALKLNEQVLKIFRSAGDAHGEASTLGNIGILYIRLNDLSKALDFFNQALPTMRAIGDTFNEIVVLQQMSTVHARQGEYGRVAELLEQALKHSRIADARRIETEILKRLSDLYVSIGESPHAIEYLKQAHSCCDKENHKLLASIVDVLAVLSKETGQVENAIDYLRQLVRCEPESAEAHIRLALLLVEMKRIKEALVEAKEAVRCEPDSGDYRGILASTLFMNGDLEESFITARQALPFIDGEGCSRIATMFNDGGYSKEAEPFYREALRRAPNHGEGYLNLARILIERSTVSPEEIKEFREAIRCNPEKAELHFALAWALMKGQQLDEAIQEFHNGIALQPDYPMAYLGLGFVLEMANNTDEVIEHAYREALRRDPKLAFAHYFRGRTLVRQGKKQEGFDEFREAVTCDPNLVDARRLWASGLLDRREYAQSESEYRECLRAEPECCSAHEGLGIALYHQNKKGEAESQFRKALELDPRNVRSLNGLGVILLDQAEVKQAEKLFRDAIDVDSKLGYVHLNLGRALIGQNPLEAEKAFREAIRLDVEGAVVHNLLALSLEAQKKFDDAAHEYRDAIAREPSFALARVRLAKCLTALGRHLEAEHELREAISLDPALPEAHFQLGQALFGQDRNPEAIEAARVQLRFDPDHLEARLLLAVGLLSEGNTDEAEEEYREIIRRRPDTVLARELLAKLLRFKDQVEEAERQCREWLKLMPDSAEAYQFLGKLLSDQARHDEAREAYRMAIERDANNAAVHNDLGLVLNELWLFNEAEAEYREAVRCDPELPQVHENLGSLLARQYYYEEAEKECREVVRLVPDSPESYHQLGAVLAGLKRFEEAAQAYSKAIDLRAESDGSHNNLGLAMVQLGRFREAEIAYRKAIQINSNLIVAHQNLCAVLASQNRFAEVIEHYEIWMHQSPDLSQLHDDLINALVAHERVDDAIKAYQEWTKCDSSNSSYWGLIRSLEQQGRWDDVFTIYRDAIARDPESIRAREALVNSLIATAHYHEAEGECQRWIQAKPEALQPRLSLSELHLRQNQPEEGLIHGQEAMRLARNDFSICQQVAGLLKNANRLSDVEILYRDWIKCQDEASSARHDLAEHLLDIGDLRRAEVEYLDWIGCEPTNARAYHEFSIFLAKSERLEEALERAREALCLYQHTGQIWEVNWMVERWLDLDYPRGLQLFDEAIVLETSDEHLYRIRAEAEWRHGDLDAALADYNFLIKSDARNSSLFSDRGQVKAEKGDYSSAIEDLSTAATIFERSGDIDGLAYSRSGLALAYAGLDKVVDAMRLFDLSIESRPDNAWVYYNRALVYQRLGKAAEAKNDYQLSLQKKSPALTALKAKHANHYIVGSVP